MKSSVVGLIAVVVVGAGLWFGWAEYEAFLTQGQEPPESVKILDRMEREGVKDFGLPDINGNEVRLSQFKDKIVIVNFWASWCDPCVEEFPSLLRLIEHFKGEVVLLAISADYTVADLNNFLKAFKADDPSMKVMWDKDQKIAKSFGTKVLPESYILRGHKLIRKVAGVDNWYSQDALSYFTRLVAGDDDPTASKGE